jgi:sugar phosphate isomerase/epimerase
MVLRETTGATVDLGIENHGPIANDPAWLDAALRELDDPRVGLTLDTGNFYWFGLPREEVYRLIEKYARRVKHTHVKNIDFPPDQADRRREVGHGYKEYCCGVDEGKLDLRRVLKILRDAGYDRDLCIEDESLFKVPPDRRVEALRRQVRALTDAVATVAR